MQSIEGKDFPPGGDAVQSLFKFNAMNKKFLMTLEIHECMEAGHFTHVHEDNSYSLENGGEGLQIVKMDDGETVLCLPSDYDYSEWREVYNKLMK